MIRVAFAFAFLTLAAAPIAGAASSARLLDITIREGTGDGLWRATYRFSNDVDRVDFQRNGVFKRIPAWQVQTPGYALLRVGDVESIRRSKGARKRSRITVAFPLDTTHPEKDYQLFQRFSDGSLLLFTGH